MIVQYTAKRSLTAGHLANQIYVLSADLTDAIRSRIVEKTPVRALSGRTETLWHRSETEWALTFAPVRGTDLALLREFLDSTSSEEEFSAWLYGDESSPITVRRSDSGYNWQSFMRVGAEHTDLFTTSIQVVEVE